MKKLLSIALTLALALSFSVTAFAEDHTVTEKDNLPITKDTTVNFTVEPTYTVTIPSTVVLTKDAESGDYEQDAEIIASAGVRLLEGQTIQITLDSDFKLTTDAEAATYELPYTVTVDNEEIDAENKVVATFDTSTVAQKETLHFSAENPEYAGNYSDNVIFNISIVS